MDRLTVCLILLYIVLLIPINSYGQGIQAPVLNDNANSEVATAGFYSLEWTLDPGVDLSSYTFEVQESDTPSFDEPGLIYAGQDLATAMSGKPDGMYYYRIRTVSTETGETSDWSPIYEVEVAHHSLQRAFFFLGLGAFVFLCTLVVILRGHLQEGRIESYA